MDPSGNAIARIHRSLHNLDPVDAIDCDTLYTLFH